MDNIVYSLHASEWVNTLSCCTKVFIQLEWGCSTPGIPSYKEFSVIRRWLVSNTSSEITNKAIHAPHVLPLSKRLMEKLSSGADIRHSPSIQDGFLSAASLLLTPLTPLLRQMSSRLVALMSLLYVVLTESRELFENSANSFGYQDYSNTMWVAFPFHSLTDYKCSLCWCDTKKKNVAGKLAIGCQLFCLCTMVTSKVLTVINVLRQSEVLQSSAATTTSLGSDRIILIGWTHACKLCCVQYYLHLDIRIYQISKDFNKEK